MCPDAQTAIAFTRASRNIYILRPKILTTDLSKLVWTLEKLTKHERFLESFLECCKGSPLQHTEFRIVVSKVAHRVSIMKIFPHAEVDLALRAQIDALREQLLAMQPDMPPAFFVVAGMVLGMASLNEYLGRFDVRDVQNDHRVHVRQEPIADIPFISAQDESDEDLYGA